MMLLICSTVLEIKRLMKTIKADQVKFLAKVVICNSTHNLKTHLFRRRHAIFRRDMIECNVYCLSECLRGKDGTYIV